MSRDETAMNRPREVMARCIELFNHGRLPEAERLVEAGVETFPDDGDLWQMRGRLRHCQEDFSGACEAIETASLLVPLTPMSRFVLAESYLRMGRKALAADLFRLLATDARCSTEMLPRIASNLGGIGEYEAALETCRELLRRDSAWHQAHFGEAYYLRRLGHPAEAVIPAVTRAHELAPGVVLYRVCLASLLAHSGEHEEAYGLLRGVDPRSVGCGCCLRRMMSVFLHAGDLDRYGACRVQADRMTDSADGGEREFE